MEVYKVTITKFSAASPYRSSKTVACDDHSTRRSPDGVKPRKAVKHRDQILQDHGLIHSWAAGISGHPTTGLHSAIYPHPFDPLICMLLLVKCRPPVQWWTRHCAFFGIAGSLLPQPGNTPTGPPYWCQIGQQSVVSTSIVIQLLSNSPR